MTVGERISKGHPGYEANFAKDTTVPYDTPVLNSAEGIPTHSINLISLARAIAPVLVLTSSWGKHILQIPLGGGQRDLVSAS